MAQDPTPLLKHLKHNATTPPRTGLPVTPGRPSIRFSVTASGQPARRWSAPRSTRTSHCLKAEATNPTPGPLPRRQPLWGPPHARFWRYYKTFLSKQPLCAVSSHSFNHKGKPLRIPATRRQMRKVAPQVRVQHKHVAHHHCHKRTSPLRHWPKP